MWSRWCKRQKLTRFKMAVAESCRRQYPGTTCHPISRSEESDTTFSSIRDKASTRCYPSIAGIFVYGGRLVAEREVERPSLNCRKLQSPTGNSAFSAQPQQHASLHPTTTFNLPQAFLSPQNQPFASWVYEMLYNLSVYGLPCLIILGKSPRFDPPVRIAILTPTIAPVVAIYHRHTVLQHLPASIVDRLPARLTQSRHYAPLNSFAGQRAAGLHSSAFDIEANISEGDSRMGLDEAGAAEVAEIMRTHRVK